MHRSITNPVPVRDKHEWLITALREELRRQAPPRCFDDLDRGSDGQHTCMPNAVMFEGVIDLNRMYAAVLEGFSNNLIASFDKRPKAREDAVPEDLTGRIFHGWKALYRGEPLKPAKLGHQTPWICQCTRCNHEQLLLPLAFKTYRPRCRNCDYVKSCVECGNPVNRHTRRRYCSDDCCNTRKIGNLINKSSKDRFGVKLARSQGFDASYKDAKHWRQWAESLGVNFDHLAKDIA